MDLLVLDPVTGARTATALAVRGLPRMTRGLDVAAMVDDAASVIEALRSAGLRAETPFGSPDDPEPIVFVDPATGFGVEAPVTTLEHLLLQYLYSNQPKHLGDFAAIVTSGRADLGAAERKLNDIHPEMLDEWRRRVRQAQQPPPAPPRPAPRRRPKR